VHDPSLESGSHMERLFEEVRNVECRVPMEKGIDD
jgi:hypothetical protein